MKLMLLLSIPIFAQNVQVISIEKLNGELTARFFYPKFIDETRIAVTTPNYKGLWLIDENKNIAQLNDFDAAGYEFKYLQDENSVICRKDKFVDGMRFTDLVKQNIDNGEVKVLHQNLRDVKLIDDARTKSVSLVSENQVQSINNSANTTSVFANAEGLHLFQNGSEKIIQPLGDGNYIWASLSPNGQKILFNFPSKGSFVCDLSGNILFELGYANYPTWSRDGNWIVYMKDYDNGVEITSSDIFIRKYLDKEEINLTNTNDVIELYPSYSKYADEILFNSAEGDVYKISLKFN